MKFKSALGIAALEELTEDQVPAADEVAAAPTEGDKPVEDAPAADAVPAADAPIVDAPAVDAPASDAPAAEPTAEPAAEPTADAPAASDAPAVGADDAAAASAADSAAAAVDAVGEPAEVVADAAPVDADAEVVEEQMTEVDQIEEKTNDVQEDVEKLEVATESLEGCVAILDAAAQRGGLDIFGASLLRNNVNTVTKSLKVKPLMLPALEDMETPSSKIDGAQTAKEQIVAFIKRIIEAIKSAFVRIGEWIVETYKRLTDAFVAVERRAQKLAERVKASKMKEGKIDNKSLATKMIAGNEPVTDLADFLTKLADAAKYLNDPKTYKLYLDAIDKCEEMAKNPEKSEEIRGEISTILDKWAEEISKHGKDQTMQARFTAALSGNSAEHTASRMVKFFAVPLLNAQGLLVTIPETAEGINDLAASVRDAVKKPTAGDLSAMDQATAEKVCQVVIQIAKEARESGVNNKGGVKELIGEIEKRKTTIVAMANAAGEKMGESAGVPESVRKAIAFINTMLLSAPKLPVHAINRALPRNLGYALDYVAASLGGAAEAEPAAA